jgi:hypothetical protein
MFKINLFVSLLVVGMSFQNVYADDINSALQKTQDCLINQNCDPATTDAGKAADQKALEAVGGSALDKQELYNIAADIMPILVQQAGEDPTKMQAILLKAQADPVNFLNSLPPEIQVKIKNAANAVDKNQAPIGQNP